MDLATLPVRINQIVDAVETAIIGKKQTVQSSLAVLLSNGHLLIEDIPGVGKTTLTKALARALGCNYKRIQFTPDLLPSDVTGTSVFNQKSAEFEFRAGPVFSNIVLADEINRSTPKTQSSLLECMEERQVTSDGNTYRLPSPFFVLATQNNIELAGTYPLPEAQLDRFTARISIGYPGHEAELAILQNQIYAHPVDNIKAVTSPDEVVEMQRLIRNVHVDSALSKYILNVVASTRNHPSVGLGASPRGSLNLLYASQAMAAVLGREYVTPDDIKLMASPVLAHRIIVKPEHRVKGITAESCIMDILHRIAIPVGVAAG